MNITEVTTSEFGREVIDSLHSRTCPACGGFKRPRNSLCYAEYMKLPAPIRRDLYKVFGAGYEEALAAAFKHLGKTDFIMPPPKPTKKEGPC